MASQWVASSWTASSTWESDHLVWLSLRVCPFLFSVVLAIFLQSGPVVLLARFHPLLFPNRVLFHLFVLLLHFFRCRNVLQPISAEAIFYFISMLTEKLLFKLLRLQHAAGCALPNTLRKICEHSFLPLLSWIHQNRCAQSHYTTILLLLLTPTPLETQSLSHAISFNPRVCP